MLRIPLYLDSRLADGGKFVSPTHRPCSTPQKYYVYAPGIHLLETEKTPGPNAAGIIR
jgi:hypothetical protein